MLLINLHNTNIIKRTRVQDAVNRTMQSIRVRFLRMDGHPFVLDLLYMHMLLRQSTEPELVDFFARLVYVLRGNNRVEVIVGFAACRKLYPHVGTAGANEAEEQRVP